MTWAVGAFTATITVTTASFATRVQLLPDVVDISSIPTASGVVSLIAVFYGALRSYGPDRVGRLAMFGTLLGGVGYALLLSILLVTGVFS